MSQASEKLCNVVQVLLKFRRYTALLFTESDC